MIPELALSSGPCPDTPHIIFPLIKVIKVNVVGKAFRQSNRELILISKAKSHIYVSFDAQFNCWEARHTVCWREASPYVH